VTRLAADWCSIFQKDESGHRARDEREAFNVALQDMSLWFAHQLTTVLLLTSSAERYYVSGWTTYESAIARVVKRRRPDLWDAVYDVGCPGDARHLLPPMSEEQFRTSVLQLAFTEGSDRALVFQLYVRTLQQALSGASAFSYDRRSWRGMHMALLVRVIPLCASLRTLNLSGNALGQDALDRLAEAIGRGRALPQLKVLDMSHNPLNGQSKCLQRFAEALSKQSTHPAGLPLLNRLFLHDCGLSVITLFNFYRVLKPGALPMLVQLSLGGTTAGFEAEALVELSKCLLDGVMPRLQEVTHNELLGGVLRQHIVYLSETYQKRVTKLRKDNDGDVQQRQNNKMTDIAKMRRRMLKDIETMIEMTMSK
jgi:hypothetical protein